MIVEVSAIPLGYRSLSEFVAKILREIESLGIKYQINPMGTVIELESFQKLAEVLERINKILEESGSERNYYVVKIDTKKGKMEEKVESVLRKK
ncbi:MAG: MTH1187 family thiamine-binding protein [Archaeoglobaceae archaeon]|nr:MTH1187 family thiamine-binding protein [Archaeoglobaceae archaeon]MCX8151859.1 MTH1187 family thiamine-binding protein [Archaeoglobaceae archaeon]MDW8014309.1 MTH1187 family thiamine-binding protein [Archaeoglobaceae archaeon]